ncbi:MAG: glycosyltransferase [Ferruginibacter sp.]
MQVAAFLRRTLVPQSFIELMVLFSITFVLLLLYGGLLFYYRAGWLAIPQFKDAALIKDPVFITVIVAARNEEDNLPALLQCLKDQTYPTNNFEVIIVNDHSTDNTEKVLKNFPLQNLQLINLADHVGQKINSYKKKAIEIAVAQSKGELIVTTDADCKVPPQWLQTIAGFYAEKKPGMIVMPVAIRNNGTGLGLFQSIDFMTLQGITGGAVNKDFHPMSNGANLAYTKQIFNEVNGFSGVDAIASGDDMLLMNKILKLQPGSIQYLKSTNVTVQTEPMKTVSDFMNQRIRWASKSGNYGDAKIMWVLGLVYILNVLLLVFAVMIAFGISWQKPLSPLVAWLILITFKTLGELFFLHPVATFFKKENELWLFPLLQPFHIVYTVVAGWLGMFGSYRWKERKVK